MKIIQVAPSSLGFALAFLCAGCSTPTPYVGEKSVTTPLAEGVQVTEQEKRFLLPTGELGGTNSALLELRATVAKIDREKRLLTLRSAGGKIATIKAGPEVRNFSKIAVGDEVTAEYVETIAFETRRPTDTELKDSDAALAVGARARLGDKPGAMLAASQVKVVTIISVDKANSEVVIQDAQGVKAAVKAQYPQNLAFVKAGDKVVITYTEAVAARVLPVTPDVIAK